MPKEKKFSFQKKDIKLLMKRDWYNSIIMACQKIAEATSDLIGNKVTKDLQNS